MRLRAVACVCVRVHLQVYVQVRVVGVPGYANPCVRGRVNMCVCVRFSAGEQQCPG